MGILCSLYWDGFGRDWRLRVGPGRLQRLQQMHQQQQWRQQLLCSSEDLFLIFILVRHVCNEFCEDSGIFKRIKHKKPSSQHNFPVFIIDDTRENFTAPF